MHQAQREREIAAGMNWEYLVRQLSGPVNDWIDDVEFGFVSSRLDDEGPKMDVRPEDVRPPGNDQFRVLKLLRLHPIPRADAFLYAGPARRRTDSAVEA